MKGSLEQRELSVKLTEGLSLSINLLFLVCQNPIKTCTKKGKKSVKQISFHFCYLDLCRSVNQNFTPVSAF